MLRVSKMAIGLALVILAISGPLTRVRASEMPEAPWPSTLAPVGDLVEPAKLAPPPHPNDAWSPFSGPVSAQALVAYAVANNPEIQAARYRARAMGARVPQVASLPDPQLMTTAFTSAIQTAAGAQEVMMSLSQKFPWFGKLDLQSRIAYHDAMAAYAELGVVELRVIEQVKHGYFSLYYAQSAIRETEQLQPLLEDVVAISTTRFETGVQAIGLESVLAAQNELSKLRTKLISLEQAKRSAQADLLAVLPLDFGVTLEPENELRPTEVLADLGALFQLAEEQHPGLEARRREICRDSSQVDLACRNYWPDVTLGVNWYEIDSSGISPVSNGRDAASLTIGVNLPLYRGRLDAAVREAQFKTAADNRRYSAARDQLRGAIGRLHAQLLEEEQILAVLRDEILPRAEQTLELSLEAYRLGRLQYQQLIDTYRTLLDYRIDFHRRIATREQLAASIERTVGINAAR